HPDDFDDAAVATHLSTLVARRTDAFRERERWGSIRASELLGPFDEDPPLAERSIAIASAAASHRTETIGEALDGTVATRWTSTKPQTGDEWVRIGLRAPDAPSQGVLRVNPIVLSDYPRRLEIDAESPRTVTHGFSGS